jgi:DNA (cytosine-5)-methyltransferase 1
MENTVEFRKWLEEKTEYTKETKSNIVSRLKRADGIIPIVIDEVYLFNLSNHSEFQKMSVSVKSQIRRAIRLYFEFMKESGE